MTTDIEKLADSMAYRARKTLDEEASRLLYDGAAALLSLKAERDEARRAEHQTYNDAAQINVWADKLKDALHDLLTRPTDPAARARARAALAGPTLSGGNND